MQFISNGCTKSNQIKSNQIKSNQMRNIWSSFILKNNSSLQISRTLRSSNYLQCIVLAASADPTTKVSIPMGNWAWACMRNPTINCMDMKLAFSKWSSMAAEMVPAEICTRLLCCLRVHYNIRDNSILHLSTLSIVQSSKLQYNTPHGNTAQFNGVYHTIVDSTCR